MTTHSSVLAWRIAGTGEPGGLPSVGSHRVGHDWSDSAAAAAYLESQLDSWVGKIPWRKDSPPTPVFWASLVAHIKNPPAMWEIWVGSLFGKIPWKRAWQPTPVFLLRESLWTEEPDRLQSMGSWRIRHEWVTKHSTVYLESD